MSSKLTHYFESLTHGNIYHILVSVIDRAGNESDVRCSPYTEVDLYAPSLVITDPSSNPGFVRDDDGEVLVEIGNDLDDGFWCITNDLDFNPPESQDPTSLVSCPGGFGPSDGWLTESPSELTLPTDEGQQDYCLWLVRTDGSLVSNNNVCVSLIYDNTPPDAFNILGVHGDTDETIDAWLTSHTLIVDWAPSSGLNHYNLSLEDNTSQELCRIDEIPADHVRFDMTADCPELANGETYYLKMQAVDEANNRTDAPDFPFTVDRTPPGDFLITGVRGGDDMTIDAILGTSAPEVFFTPSSGAHTGRIEIQDMAGSTVCPSSEFSISGDSYTHAGCSPLTHASTYRILMSTFDQGRNQTLAENTPFTFLVDQEPPEIVFTSQPESITQDTSATIHFTVVDDLTDVDSIECSENSGAWSDCTSPQSLTSLPDGMHELGVRSRDIAGNLNQESVSWIVDTTPPVLTLSSVPTNYVNTTAQSMTFSATDENDIDYYECALNGASWAGCSSPFNMTAVVGTNIAAVRAFDPAGNHHELTTSFLVDVEPPVLAFTDTPDVITASSDATFIWSASDPGDSGIDTVECSLNAGAWAACSSPHSLTGLAEQAHNFRVRATDRAGNTSDPISYDWDVYQSGPALSFDLTPSSLNNLTSVDFEYSGTVPSGVTVTGYECNLNAGGWTSCGSPQSFSGLTEQTQELQVRGLDSLGNTGNPISYSWVTDLTDPVVVLAAISPFTNMTSQEVTFTASDTGGADTVAYIECSLDGAGFSECSSPLNLTSLPVGTREIEVRATDTAGNTSTPVSGSWLIDLEDPVLAFTDTPDTITANSDATFIWTGTDPGDSGIDTVECSLNAGAWAACSSPHSLTGLAEQAHNFRVRATDRAGNTSDPISYDWDVYQSGPALSFDLTPSSLNNLTSVDFEYSGTVPSGVTVTGYECNLNAGGWTSCGSPQSFSGLTEQTQELQVRGLDSLGNTGNPIAYSWVTDLTAPVVTLSSPGDYSNETSQTFTFSATDTGGADEVAGFECSLDGASFASCSSPMNLSGLSDGGREFQVRATDTVGNTSSPVTASWLIDLEPPTVSITSGPTGTTHNETSFNFTFNHGDTGGSGVASVQCRLNSGSWSTCSSPHTVNTAAGSHTFTVRVTDGAGNQTTDSQSWLSYTYSWNTTSWSSCSANPTWSGWSSCSASPYWGSWGSCSASCGGGTQTRTCFGTSGTRTRSCSGTSGTQTRTVTCLRNDGVAVSDSYCTASKPTESQACTQSCSGSSTQSCTQSCSGSSSQSCNTHSCGLSSGSIVPGSSICTANPGFFCSGTVTGSSVGCDASLCASNSATRECTATPCTTVHGDPGTSSRCRCN